MIFLIHRVLGFGSDVSHKKVTVSKMDYEVKSGLFSFGFSYEFREMENNLNFPRT